jgi:hypothetical protein
LFIQQFFFQNLPLSEIDACRSNHSLVCIWLKHFAACCRWFRWLSPLLF